MLVYRLFLAAFVFFMIAVVCGLVAAGIGPHVPQVWVDVDVFAQTICRLFAFTCLGLLFLGAMMAFSQAPPETQLAVGLIFGGVLVLTLGVGMRVMIGAAIDEGTSPLPNTIVDSLYRGGLHQMLIGIGGILLGVVWLAHIRASRLQIPPQPPQQ